MEPTKEHSDAGDDELAHLAELRRRHEEVWQLEQACDELLDELTATRTDPTRMSDETADSSSEPPSPEPSRSIPQPSSPTPGMPEAEGPRSVGEQLRSRIVTPEPKVAPPQQYSPPPSGDVDKVDVRVDLAPSAGTPPKPGEDDRGSRTEPPVSRPESKEFERSVGAEEPETPAAQSASARTEDPEDDAEPAALRPEATPDRTREDDLAAAGMRHDAQADEDDLEASGVDPDIQRGDASASSSVGHRDDVVEELQPARDAHRAIVKVRKSPVRSQRRGRVNPVVAILVGIVAIAAPVWFLFFNGSGGTDQAAESIAPTTAAPSEEASPGAGEQTEAAVDEQTDGAVGDQIQAAVDALGRGEVTVEEINGVVYLVGGVPTEADRQAIIGAAEALAAENSVDSTALSVLYYNDQLRLTVLNALSAAGFDRVNASVQDGLVTVSGVAPDGGTAGLADAVLHVEGANALNDTTEAADRAPALGLQLERLTMVTPIGFVENQGSLTGPQKAILDETAQVIAAYPGPMVTIVAYGDYETVATAWAEQARDYLVTRGIPSDRLAVSARTPGADEGTASGQRMEFEAGYALVARGTPDFLIGIVARGTRNDFALTHSVADAAMAMAMERTDLGVDITDGMGTTGEAESAIRNYARDRYDLVIVEGSDLGRTVEALAAEYPDVAFVLADSSDTYDIPNVSAMRVAADEGGYVLGVLSAQMSSSGVLGVMGDDYAGSDARYFDGFAAGALSINAEATVLTAFTQTDDLAVAAARASEQIAAGADVITGSGGVGVAGVGVAADAGTLWFGNQADPALLDPDVVVASQVYHWESAIRRIIAGIDQGSLGGQAYVLNLSNGGLVIEYNPDYALDDALKASVDYVVSGLTTGSISTGV